MRKTYLSTLLFVCLCTVLSPARDVTLTIDPDRAVAEIDNKIYGHFLEHIYHSVNGGLWGELIWNRSFEQNELGQWMVADNKIAQESMGTNVRLTFGDADWGNYEYTLEARKTGGQEGFLILFRVKNEEDFYWCNLGGWNNTRHAIERGNKGRGRWGDVGPYVRVRIDREPDPWIQQGPARSWSGLGFPTKHSHGRPSRGARPSDHAAWSTCFFLGRNTVSECPRDSRPRGGWICGAIAIAEPPHPFAGIAGRYCSPEMVDASLANLRRCPPPTRAKGLLDAWVSAT